MSHLIVCICVCVRETLNRFQIVLFFSILGFEFIIAEKVFVQMLQFFIFYSKISCSDTFLLNKLLLLENKVVKLTYNFSHRISIFNRQESQTEMFHMYLFLFSTWRGIDNFHNKNVTLEENQRVQQKSKQIK